MGEELFRVDRPLVERLAQRHYREMGEHPSPDEVPWDAADETEHMLCCACIEGVLLELKAALSEAHVYRSSSPTTAE